MKPLYYRSVSSKGAGRPRLTHHHKGGWNETKWMRWVWRNEICVTGKREKPREKPTQTPFRPPRNPHGVTETRTRDPSGGRRAPNRLRHEAAFLSPSMYSSSLSTHRFIRVLHSSKQCYSSSTPRPFSSCAVFAFSSSTDGKWAPFSTRFTLGYRKISRGAKSTN